MCVCSLRYATCNTHAPYCYLWHAPALQCFSTLSHVRQDFREKKVIECKICCDFPYNFELFLILRKIELDIINKCIVVFTKITRYSCQILMKLEFS